MRLLKLFQTAAKCNEDAEQADVFDARMKRAQKVAILPSSTIPFQYK
jgi:hypothetical protein